jgi:hypothetical protein
VTDVVRELTAALADRYRIERELGVGGMATVYLAHDLRHEREVAIKVLHPDLGAALGAERFLSEPVRPVTVLRPAVPVHVDAAIQVALQKLAADRFATVAEFSEALLSETGARASHALLTAALPATSRGRRGMVVAVGGVGLAALGLGWMVGRGASAPAAELPSFAVSLAGALANETAIAGIGIALSADGSLIAVSAPDSIATSHLVIRDLTRGGGEVELEREGVPAAFSPDWRSLAYSLPGASTIRVVGVAGGLPTTVTSIPNAVRGMTWMDDTTLVLGGLRRIILGRSSVDTLPRPGNARAATFPHRVSPDEILLSVGDNPELAEVGIYSLADGSFRSFGVRGQNAAYVDPGIVLYWDEGTVWGLEVDPRRWTPRGSPRAVVDGRTGRPVISFSAARNGVLAVRRSASGPAGVS